MPLGAFEREVLRLLAANRNPDSYIGGTTVLNQDPTAPRTSKDVNVFHDAVESLTESADRDMVTLSAAGFEVVEAGRGHESFRRAVVLRGGEPDEDRVGG